MAVTKRYIVQIVVMTTIEQGKQIKAMADRFGVSVAQTARDAIELGLPGLPGHYEKLGISKPTGVVRDAVGARAHGAKVRRAGRKSRSIVPEAQFTSPSA